MSYGLKFHLKYTILVECVYEMASSCNPAVLPTMKSYEDGLPIPTVKCNTIGAQIPLPTQGTFSFKSLEHDLFMETRPNVIRPIPLDMPGGQCNFSYVPYQRQLFTSSNVYLNCPIWRRPLEPELRIVNDEYRQSRYDGITDAHRLIFEDMRELNK